MPDKNKPVSELTAGELTFVIKKALLDFHDYQLENLDANLEKVFDKVVPAMTSAIEQIGE